jgi:hypothetical protein
MGRGDKPNIGLIEDASECHDVKTGKAVPFYTFNPGDYGGKLLRNDAEEATLEELVELCDQDAESVNAHDFCGAHRLLAAVLYRNLGRATATDVMRDIAYRRGLHGMNGLCGLRDSYADLKVGQSGRDWSGSFGK